MEIKIGTTYKVEPSRKKSMEEVETFSDGNGRYADVSELWRGGAYWVTPRDEEEVSQLQTELYEEDNEEKTYYGLTVSEFEDAEMDHTWDGCASDIELYGNAWTDEDREKFELEYWEDQWETLERWNLQPEEFEMTIYNGILVTEEKPSWME